MVIAACATARATPAPEPAAPEEPAAEAPTEEALAVATFVLPTPSPASTPTGEVGVPILDIPSGGGGLPPAIYESRRLTLEFPPVMRTGDSSRIRLQLEVDDQGNITPTAIVEGNVVTGETVEIPSLYETHNVVAEARLDMAGMEVQPPGTISEPLLPGQSVTFYWSVRPENSGKYEGTAWLHLRFIPKDSSSGEPESRIAVSVQFLEIQANSFLGFLNGGTARGIGTLGSLVGSVLGFPFADDLIKWFWGKFWRKKA